MGNTKVVHLTERGKLESLTFFLMYLMLNQRIREMASVETTGISDRFILLLFLRWSVAKLSGFLHDMKNFVGTFSFHFLHFHSFYFVLCFHSILTHFFYIFRTFSFSSTFLCYFLHNFIHFFYIFIHSILAQFHPILIHSMFLHFHLFSFWYIFHSILAHFPFFFYSVILFCTFHSVLLHFHSKQYKSRNFKWISNCCFFLM